jgi:hypothetical protein
MTIQWFYRRAGVEHGPVSSGKIRRMVARGELEPTDLLWKVGMDEWRPAGESGTLFGRGEARAAKRRRAPGSGPKPRPHESRPRAAETQSLPWSGGRPLLTSIGIGTGAGVLISAVLAAVILAFSGTAREDRVERPRAVPVAAVAPPAKPAEAKPSPPQPAAAKPAETDVAAAGPAPVQPAATEPAAEKTAALATAPAAPDQPPAEPAEPSTVAAQEPEVPADQQAEVPPKPRPRIRVRLPGEDF